MERKATEARIRSLAEEENWRAPPKNGGMLNSRWSKPESAQPKNSADDTAASDPDPWNAWKLADSNDWSIKPQAPPVDEIPETPWKQTDDKVASRAAANNENRARMKMQRGDSEGESSSTVPSPTAGWSSSNADRDIHEQLEDMGDLNAGDFSRDTSAPMSPRNESETMAMNLTDRSISPEPQSVVIDNGPPAWPFPTSTTDNGHTHNDDGLVSLIDIPPQQFLNNPILDISGRWFCDESGCVNRDRPEFTGLCYRDAGEKSGHIMVVPEVLSHWITAVRNDERCVEWPDEKLRARIIEGEAISYTNEVVKRSEQLLPSRLYGRYEVPAQEEMKRFFTWLKSRNPTEDFASTEEFLQREQCDLSSIRGDFSFEIWRELQLPLGLWGRLRREVEVFQKLSDPTLKADDTLNTLEKLTIRNSEKDERFRKGWFVKKEKRRCTKCGKIGHLTESCWIESVCDKCGKIGHPTERCWRTDIGPSKTRANASESE